MVNDSGTTRWRVADAQVNGRGKNCDDHKEVKLQLNFVMMFRMTNTLTHVTDRW